MGKGFGNLRTEQIIEKKYFNIVGHLIKNYNDLLTMPQNIYTLITSKFGISDNYASKAKKINLDINFSTICSKISGKDKDNFNNKYLKRNSFDFK